MNIFIGQIYIKPGVRFPFSLQFQKWLGEALSKRVEVSEQFRNAYGAGFGVGLRISAKEGIDQPEIKGPTVFKRDKTVEFTIFLSHRARNYHESKNSVALLQQLLQAVAHVVEQLGLDASKVLADSTVFEAEFLRTPGLLDTPKSSVP